MEEVKSINVFLNYQIGLIRCIVQSAFVLTWCLAMCGSVATAQSANEQMVTASEDLENARRQQAELLAPKHFENAQREYSRYLSMVREGQSEEDLNSVLGRFRQSVNAAIDDVLQAHTMLGSLLELREEALSINAPAIAPKEYRDADDRFNKAVAKLEQDRLAEAEGLADEARVFYRAAVITSTKIGLLGPAQTALTQVRSQDGLDYVPRTYQNSQTLISDVATALDRGDTISPELIRKAQKAEQEAKHALFLLEKINTLRSDKSNWEVLILQGEGHLERVAKWTGQEFRYDESADSLFISTQDHFADEQDSLRLVISSRDALLMARGKTADSLQVAINQQQIRLAATLEQYQTDLQSRKEDLERRSRALSSDLKKQTILDAANQAQSRFSDKEAVVYRDGNEISLQMIGLIFDSGKTAVPAKAIPLLDKLSEFLIQYPDGRIVIEGHTDATGTESKNLAYSKSRAESVREYLSEKGGIQNGLIESVGLGSSKPVASNKSRTGRAKNRRIVIRLILDEGKRGSS